MSGVKGKVKGHSQIKKTKSAKCWLQSEDGLANIYQSLALTKPSIDNETPAMQLVSLSTTAKSTQIEFELEALDGDKEFALWCLLKECNEIRKHVQSLWVRYYNGKITLRIASELPNRASIII